MLQQPHSKTSPHNAFNAISLTLACSVLMFSGCQAMKTKFSSLPTAGNLAFWKKESESLQPPPPARHLDPSPTDGVGGLKSALAKVSGEGEADDYRRKIDEIKQGIASTQKKMDESLSSAEPLRSPYSGDDSGLAEATNSFKSDFKAAGNSIDQGFARAKEQGSGTRTLNDAETKFKSAVADVKQASGGGFKTPSDILSTKPANDFKAALASATADLKSSANESVKNVGFNQALGKVNHSLYDSSGKLTTGASNVTKVAADTVDTARQRFNSALGAVGDRAAEAAKSTKSFGGDLKEKIASAASELSPPLGGGDNSFKPAFTRAADPIVKDAQNLLSKAKERVAGLGGGFDYPGANKQAPSFGNVAASQSQPNAGGAFKTTPAAESSTFGGGAFNRTRVANVTPVAEKQTPPSNSSFGKPSGLSSSLTKAWNGGEKQSQLQPIQIAPATSTPGNGLRTASAQSSSFGQRAPTASSIPAAFDQGYNAMTSHVSEIDIPSKILSGSGSYAPGSVNKVR